MLVWKGYIVYNFNDMTYEKGKIITMIIKSMVSSLAGGEEGWIGKAQGIS